MRNLEMSLSVASGRRVTSPMRIRVTAICYDAPVLVILTLKQGDTGRRG